MTAGRPQPVLAPLTSSAIFLTACLEPGGEGATRDLLADLGGLTRSIGFRAPGDGLSCVASIGSSAWDRLYSGPRPARLHPFIPLMGGTHSAPATPGDILLHVRAERLDLCFELVAQIAERLAGAAVVTDEVQGFRYFDQRDLLGFVDGTENPVDTDAAVAALVGEEDPMFAGGSYVVTQKYLHDLRRWGAQPVEFQEKVIGRTKLTDIELSDEIKPSNSHVAINTVVTVDGIQRQILRHNMAFGSVIDDAFGTYFIGYAADPDVTETMLRHMFLGNPPGNYDRLLDFSTAVTGAMFFAPTVDYLHSPPPAPRIASHRFDSSLGIGSLRGSTL